MVTAFRGIISAQPASDEAPYGSLLSCPVLQCALEGEGRRLCNLAQRSRRRWVRPCDALAARRGCQSYAGGGLRCSPGVPGLSER